MKRAPVVQALVICGVCGQEELPYRVVAEGSQAPEASLGGLAAVGVRLVADQEGRPLISRVVEAGWAESQMRSLALAALNEGGVNVKGRTSKDAVT